jgi:hypothetical protein
MSLSLRCIIFGMGAAFLVTLGFFFLTGAPSQVAFALIYPSLRLTVALFGSQLATSESGANNTVSLVLATTILNLALYPLAWYFLVKVVRRFQPWS